MGNQQPAMRGRRYGRWTVLEHVTGSLWRCRCDCGTERNVAGWSLRNGDTRSCGCLRAELMAGWARHRRTTHGHSRNGAPTPEYRAWVRARASGVRMAARWRRSFLAFLEDMGPRPPGARLERIDRARGFSASNCRWAPRDPTTG